MIKRRFGELNPRNNQGLSRDHYSSGERVGWNCRFRRDIPRADVLVKGGADGPANVLWIEPQTSFQGSRYSRVSNLLASLSPTMTSFFASHLILRFTIMEMRPR